MTTSIPRQVRRIRKRSAFTLVELLVVIAIMALLMLLVVPAFTSINRGGDITKATYDVSGVLQVARSYATSNNTYVWVGFFEEDASQKYVAGSGRIVISTIASPDGTNIFASGSTQPLQVTKALKIDNMHLKTARANDALFPVGSGTGTGTNFDGRPVVAGGTNAQIGDTSPPAIGTQYQFKYPLGSTSTSSYTFKTIVQFNPRGEATVNNSTLTPIIEIGLQSTHGNVPDPTSKNVAAVQLTGVGGNVTIFRR